MLGSCLHAIARCLVVLSATEKNTSLRFTVRNKGATGVRSTLKRERTLERKPARDDNFFSDGASSVIRRSVLKL